jgi:hypothetical protein
MTQDEAVARARRITQLAKRCGDLAEYRIAQELLRVERETLDRVETRLMEQEAA